MAWEPTEVMGTAWSVFKPHWGPLVGATFVAAFIQGTINNVVSRIVGSATGNPLSDPEQMQRLNNLNMEKVLQQVMIQTAIITVILYPVAAFFRAGVIKLMLNTARGNAPNFGDIFSGASKTLNLTIAMFLKGAIILVGFLLLIVPGIYASLALSQVEFFVVDRNMSPVDAIKASWSATEGQKGNIFLYGIVSFGVMLLGLLACCLGVLVAIPVIELGTAMIFTRITGTPGHGGGNPFAGYGPPGGMPPPPNYGPPGGYGPPPGGGYGQPPGGYGPPPGGGYGPPPGYGPPGGGYGGPR